MKNYPRFPLFIDLTKKKFLVIGAGKIAKRRVITLIKYGANITIIAPNANELYDLSSDIEFINREYISGDIKGFDFVTICTDSREVNQKCFEEASVLGIYVSVADSREDSSFFFPASIVSDDISIGIVGSGYDHSFVKNTRIKLESFLNCEKSRMI